MDTQIGIQDAYSYATWPMFLMVGIIVSFLLIVVIATILRKVLKQMKKRPPKVVKAEPVNLLKLKTICLSELDKISIDLVNGRIDNREAYQRTSESVRKFVYKATHVNVLNYTLEEIKQLHMPQLEELIADYYSPEFAWESDADFADSMNKTKKVVEQWK